MANYNNLKATINANIKANGNEEITGPILNNVLNAAVNALGAGWQYMGVATPATNPGTPDSNVFYIATTAGTYTNFGSLVVAEGEVAILKYNGSWAKEVTGAATAAQVTQLGQQVIYDVSANNDGATFASLSALLSSENLSTLIPIAVRCGGMSIRFAQTSDNKYVQYRLTADEWSTNTEDWAIYSESVYVENPEFIEAKTDSEGKLLEARKIDGTKVEYCDLQVGGNTTISGDATILGKVDIQGATYTLMQNPEWIKVLTDAQDRIIAGVRKDGSVYIGQLDGIPVDVQKALDTLSDVDASLDERITALESIFSIVDNPEYIDVKVDSEDKILEGITTDGIKKINIPVDNGATIIETTDNPEFLEAKVDAEGKLIEGVNKNGEKIFGVIPPQIKQYIDENMPTGSGVSSIEYDDATGDIYATYDDESGVTDVYMEPNGDIYVESEE